MTFTKAVAEGARLQVRRRQHSAEAMATARVALIADEKRRQATAARPAPAAARTTNPLTEPTPDDRPSEFASARRDAPSVDAPCVGTEECAASLRNPPAHWASEKEIESLGLTGAVRGRGASLEH